MPLIEDPSQPPVKLIPDTPRIYKEEYRGVTVDTRYVPQKSLVTWVEGSPWTVNYYSQILGADNQVAGQQTGLDPVYQQYRLLKNLEIKVSQPLTSTQNQETKETSVTGSASTYPFMTPNNGDMFIADIGDGQEGVFRVTSTERKSIFKDATFVIDYVLVGYSDPERVNDLNRKVQETLYYLKDFHVHGQNPLLHEEDYQNVLSLESYYYSLLDLYYELCHSTKFKTLLVPGQAESTYDHFLTKACGLGFESRLNPLILKTRVLNVDGDQPMTTLTLWDLLFERDRRMIVNIAKRVGTQSTRIFSNRPLFEGIYFSGVKRVVYPIDPVIRVDRIYRQDSHEAETGGLQPSQGWGQLPTPIDGVVTIHPVLIDDYYVFSQAFYSEADTGQSLLELQTNDYLNRKALSVKTLVKLCEECRTWPMLEFYYYVPILLFLVKANIRSV